MADDNGTPKFTAKDFILEELVELRKAAPEDREAIREEIKALALYMVVSEMENLTDEIAKSVARLTRVIETLTTTGSPPAAVPKDDGGDDG